MSTEEHNSECTCEVCAEEKRFLIDLICSSMTDEGEETAAVKGKKVTSLDMDDI